MSIRNCLLIAVGALGATFASAQAQDFPSRPITLVIPFAPGGSTSIVGRGIAEKMSEFLGEKIVIDNRPGAGGTVGTRAVAKSAPDGYTLLLGYTGTLAIGPSLYKNVGYDPRKDFAPVGMIGNAPNSLVVNPDFPAKTLAELIAYAKANPGKLNYGTAGPGSLHHISGALLEQLAETLFRQWFVEEAEESWEEISLEEIAAVKYGKDHKNLKDGTIPAFGSGGLMRYVDTAIYSDESVLIPRKGSLNNVMYTDEPFWTVDTMFYTEMKKPNVAKYLYHFLNRQNLASMNVGSAVPSMTTQVLNNMPMLIPSESVFTQFESSVSESYNKIKSNTNQIKTLTQLRDTLLPKLMSGEVRVKNKQ